jgi:hypothetical protein
MIQYTEPVLFLQGSQPTVEDRQEKIAVQHGKRYGRGVQNFCKVLVMSENRVSKGTEMRQ